MNKLYVFCALVFLTACGSPGVDGTWNSVTDVGGVNFEIEITGDLAKFTGTETASGADMSFKCAVESLGEAKSKIICPEPMDGVLILSVDGDNMSVVEEGKDDVINFVRN